MWETFVLGFNWTAVLKDPGPARRIAAVALGLSLVVNILALTQPVFMLHVYDYVLPSQSGSTLFFLTLIALFLVAISASLDGLKTRFMGELSWQVDLQLRERAFLGAYRRGLISRRFGQGQFASDLETVKAFISGPGLSALMDLPWTPIFIVALFLLSPWLALLCIVFAVIVLILAIWGERRTRGLSQEANLRSRRGGRFAEDLFMSVDAIEAMGFARNVLGRWSGDARDAAAFARAAGAEAGGFTSIIKGLRIALQVLLLAAAAGLAVLGQISPGAMIAASIIGARALAPVDQAVTAWRGIVGARESWTNLTTLAKEADTVEEQPRTELPAPVGAVRVERIDVADMAEKAVILQGISFDLPAGSILAMVGPSGSGKSTLARVIAGALAPTNGLVLIDGADAKHRAREALGAATGYVPQTARLLSGTVAENIRRFGPVDDVGVIEAGQRSGAHDIILSLPQGYDTDIGDGGRRLSGGQQAAISLARALYGDPALLVLDEPFAHVDASGEAATLAAIQNARSRGKTVILVVHRPSHLANADYIAVLSKGRLVRFGPARELRDMITPAAGSAAA